MKRLFVTLLALPLLLATACQSLAPGGPYAGTGGKLLYEADTTISTSYDVAHTFVKWEKDYRTVLAPTPQIREYADHLRLNYPTWHRAAMSARNVYANARTQPNATALSLSLDVLREAVRQSNQWLATAPTSANPLLTP